MYVLFYEYEYDYLNIGWFQLNFIRKELNSKSCLFNI